MITRSDITKSGGSITPQMYRLPEPEHEDKGKTKIAQELAIKRKLLTFYGPY